MSSDILLLSPVKKVHKRWTLDVGRWTLDVGRWVLGGKIVDG